MSERFELDEELAAFVVRGNGVMVATRDRSLEPHVVRACGIEVLNPTRIAVLVPKATGARTLADLENNQAIAITVTSPINYRSVQFKGRCVAVIDAPLESVAAAEEQLRLFADALVQQGFSRQQTRNFWLFSLWRVEVEPGAAYHQTPGPGAGEPLEAHRGR